MVFYIHDQGMRISTPLDKLLRPKVVSATDEIMRTGKVKPETAPIDQHSLTVDYANVADSSHKTADFSQGRRQLIYAMEIMSSPVHSCFFEQTLNDCWLLLVQKHFHHIPVVNHQHILCGIVSDRDILRFTANNTHNYNIGSTPIQQVMSTHVISTIGSTEIRTIAEVMCHQSIGAVPIVEEHSVVGMVTRTDILRTLVKHAPIELWA